MATIFFDVFGTLVDWYGGLVREVRTHGWPLEPENFAVAARDAMFAGIREIVRGEQPWVDLSELNRRATRRILNDAGIGFSDGELEAIVAAWRRLDPWPDVRPGLARLRRRHTVATLSNGSVDMLTDIASHGGLEFDRVIGCDLFQAYKPSPATYRGAMDLVGAAPAASWMAASHPYDLASAASNGMHAAFVRRPDEWGGHRPGEEPPPEAELVVESLAELADKMPDPC